MAHNRDYKPEDIAFPDQVITVSNIVEEMKQAMLDYSMSVIVDRALPDVRDGLKPVHRRILYTLYEDGLTSESPSERAQPVSATFWAVIIPTATHRYMMQWFVLRRISQ